MTIAQKRATLFREWILATLGNHENYYYSTIVYGIPDGDETEDVLHDLSTGFYDDDLDDLLEVYAIAKRRYAKYGYFVNRQLVDTEAEALALCGYQIPNRIYKHK